MGVTIVPSSQDCCDKLMSLVDRTHLEELLVNGKCLINLSCCHEKKYILWPKKIKCLTGDSVCSFKC